MIISLVLNVNNAAPWRIALFAQVNGMGYMSSNNNDVGHLISTMFLNAGSKRNLLKHPQDLCLLIILFLIIMNTRTMIITCTNNSTIIMIICSRTAKKQANVLSLTQGKGALRALFWTGLAVRLETRCCRILEPAAVVAAGSLPILLGLCQMDCLLASQVDEHLMCRWAQGS